MSPTCSPLLGTHQCIFLSFNLFSLIRYLLPTYDNDPLLTGFDDDDDDDDNGMPIDQEARRKLIAQQKEEFWAAAQLTGRNIVGGVEAALAREVEAVKLEEGFGREADNEDER